MQSIFGNADLAALKLSRQTPDLGKVSQSLGRIKQSAMDLEKIIRTILLHARNDSFHEVREVEVNSIITSVFEFFRFNPLFQKEIDKQVALADPSPW